jgi:hypothetical protein
VANRPLCQPGYPAVSPASHLVVSRLLNPLATHLENRLVNQQANRALCLVLCRLLDLQILLL